MEATGPTRPTPISEASKSGFGEHAPQYISPPPKKTSHDTRQGPLKTLSALIKEIHASSLISEDFPAN